MKKLPVLFAFTVALLILRPHLAQADEASKHAAAEKLLNASRVEESMATMRVAQKDYLAKMMGNILPKNVTQERMAEIQKFQAQVFDRIYEEMSWEKLKPDFVQVYCDVFSEQEMADLFAFYETPLGKTLLEKTPQLTTKSVEITQKRMAVIMPEIQKMAVEFARSSAARSSASPGAE